jgi:hypothetical protein
MNEYTFIENSDVIARDAMKSINPAFSEKYATLIKFLSDNPDRSYSPKNKKDAPLPGSEEYIRLHAVSFSKSREPKAPQPPKTVPDEMVGIILHEYFNLPKEKLDDAQNLHLLSMGAENIVGDLLERYIASVIEDHGWVWCSGSLVKAVDFIFLSPDKTWVALQVKNRSNSENSSSSAIRNGTTIAKWYRTFSTKKGDNWAKFPLKEKLTEKDFHQFVNHYLIGLKEMSGAT